MNRRQLLTLCGAGLAGLAGCNSDQGNERTAPADGDDGLTRHTDSATPTATTPDTELTVKLDAFQPALVVLSVDHLQMVRSGLFLFLDISVTSGPAPSLSDFSFRFDGDDFAPTPPSEISLFRARVENGHHGGGDVGGAGWVLFELPGTGDASDAALVWPGGEWRPDEQLRARLAARPPLLTLEEWNAPETVPVNGFPTFEFTVRNEGDHLGRFVAGINANEMGLHYPVRRVSRRIPPGESRSWEVLGRELKMINEDMSDRVGDGVPDIEYELVWPKGNDHRQVRVVEEQTPTDDSGT